MRPIAPLASLSRRLPVSGRIRIGKKTTSRQGKTIPTSIDTLRFTSPDRVALELIAAEFGGTVGPWVEPKADPDQFEVITKTAQIPVVLPPDCLGGTPIYEMWGGGGIQRRCDGVLCTVSVKGPEGPEPAEVPCKCAAQNVLACKPTLRLSVIIPSIPFTGVWRLDTHSWNAAHELPGMVDLILLSQERGLTRAVLRVEKRREISDGETKEFVVPVLGLADSIEVLAAGAATVGQLGSGASPSASGEGEAADTGRHADEASPPPDGSGLVDTQASEVQPRPSAIDSGSGSRSANGESVGVGQGRGVSPRAAGSTSPRGTQPPVPDLVSVPVCHWCRQALAGAKVVALADGGYAHEACELEKPF